MNSVNIMLRALECPFAEEFRCDIRQHVIALVNWIEDRKIRELEIDERVTLREDSEQWDSRFSSYLEQVNCPYTWPNNSPDCISWLVSHAVAIEYDDVNDRSPQPQNFTSSGSKHSSASPSRIAKTITANDKGGAKIPAGLRDKIEAIAQAVGLRAYDTTSDTDLLQDCWRTLKLRLESEPAERICSEAGKSGLLQSFSLGFSTNDPLIDSIALVEKMLYLSDFRDLQDEINDLISSVQDYTANPRLNSALGKVGR